jgi:putative cell wall-binding protein
MTAIQRLTELFAEKQTTAVELYWSLLSTDDFDPEQLHEAAVRIGKSSEDVERDAELLSELKASPMPDLEKADKAFRTANKKAQKAIARAHELKTEAGKKMTEGEALRAKAQHDKQEVMRQRQRHIRASKALSARGFVHPDGSLEASSTHAGEQTLDF